MRLAMRRCLLAVLLVLPLLGSDSPKEYDDKVKAAALKKFNPI